MEANQMEEIVSAMSNVIEKSVPEIVDGKISEALSKTVKEIEEIKSAIKDANLSAKSSSPEAKSAFAKTAMVSIFKDVVEGGITTEKQFNEVVEKNIKAMSEGTATEGAELVFDQFEMDVLRVINTHELVNSVRILPLAKGDKVSLPKATNGITTYFVNEGVAYTESEAATGFITIDIAKACTLTDMTQELLDDTMTVPDLYNLIVEFIGESQAEFLENQIVSGTGSIVGILNTAGINEVALNAAETAKDISDTDVVNVLTSIEKKYVGEKVWVMSQYVYGKLLALKTADGYPLYPELRNFASPSLLGKRIIITDATGLVNGVADDVADATLAIYGDLNRFILVNRKGMTLERGYYGDNWKKDIPSLKSNRRFGGKVTFEKAFTVLKNGAVA